MSMTNLTELRKVGIEIIEIKFLVVESKKIK